MQTAETALIRQDIGSESHSDDAAWRARMLQADVDALSGNAGDLQSLVQQLTAMLGRGRARAGTTRSSYSQRG